MRQITSSLFAALLAGVLSTSALGTEYTAFTNVNVLTMTDDVARAGQTVLVRADRIYAIGDEVSLPRGTQTIDGSGKYLLPGLAEMHGHTPVPGGNARAQAVQDMMMLYVANGITTLRGMLGAPGQLELRGLVADGEIIGPTLFLAGPSFNGDSINSPQAATAKVERQVREGWDLLKVHPGLTRHEYDAMATAAHRRGIRFGGHVPQDVGLEHAIRMGQHTFDHIDGYLTALGFPDQPVDTTALARLVQLSRASQVAIVPTLVLWDHVIGLGDADEKMKWPENAYWPKAQVQRWYAALKRRSSRPQVELQAYSDARSQVLRALHAGGVQILMGTDSPQIFSVPGFSIHREMAAMVAAGLTPAEVLATGTREVAQYLDGTHAIGLVAPGFQADLILVSANPIDNLATLERPDGVMVRGRWLSRKALDAHLGDIRARVAGSR